MGCTMIPNRNAFLFYIFRNLIETRKNTDDKTDVTNKWRKVWETKNLRG